MNIKEVVSNVKEMKEFKNTKAEYIEVINKINAVEQIERECKQEILKNNIFNMNNKSYELRLRRNPNLKQRIIEVNQDCTMDQEDMERYCKLVHELRIQKGLKVNDWESTATCELNNQKDQLEYKLINILLELSPIEIKEDIKKVFTSFKFRNQALETIINIA